MWHVENGNAGQPALTACMDSTTNGIENRQKDIEWVTSSSERREGLLIMEKDGR